MASILDYSTTAGSNTTVGGVSVAEGMTPGSVNNAIRAFMADARKAQIDISGVTTSAGAGNAYTFVSSQGITAYSTGMRFCFEADKTNSGAATFNVDGVGAKAIKLYSTSGIADVGASSIQAGAIYDLVYEAGADCFVILNAAGASLAGLTASVTELNVLDGIPATLTATELGYVDGVTSAIQTQLNAKQASDATLTSLSGLSLVAGDLLYATAADTLVRLPKGTAAQQLVMNAGATAPEWVTPATVSSGLTFISTQDFSSTATGDFVLTAGYDAYVFIAQNLVPVNDGVNLLVRTSTDGGSTYDAGGSDYAYTNRSVTMAGVPAETFNGSNGATSILAGVNIGSAAGEDGLSGKLTVYGPHLTKKTIVTFEGAFEDSSGVMRLSTLSGARLAADDVDAVRWLFSGGAIESGTITLYGMKNA